MIFSQAVFLYIFFPLTLLLYFVALRNREHRNVLLTIMSLFFYAWGEPVFVLVMLGSIVLNWYCGLKVDRSHPLAQRKRWVAISVIANLLILGGFKYLKFFMVNINWAFHLTLPTPEIALPLGISFFTFQAMSYVIDVYRGNGKAQKSLLDVCLYIAFFPGLIAGPIVRYETFAGQIEDRKETLSDFAEGARRFMVGLAKKVIIADNLALLVRHAYQIPGNELSVSVAWFAAIFAHVQVFFDFSGYSDMAIGLSRMFGFKLLENFHYPMLAKSVGDFWRRWHISLSTWFRDYVFFPLGGSRVSKARLIFNMLILWSLTGLWHGADWNYLLWGLGFALIMILERFTGLGKWMEHHWVGYVYSNAVVCAITVLLATAMNVKGATVPMALERMGVLFGIGANGLWDATATMYVREYGAYIFMAVIFSLPTGDFLQKKLHIPANIMEIFRALGLACALIVTVSYIAMGGFSPFVYANF